MARISISDAGGNGKNRIAFLDMIAASEIGPRLLALSDDGYNVLVGSIPSKPLLFKDYNNHPNIYNPATNSTAAGRYQILWRYWVVYKIKLRLPDFSPKSQDFYAIQQFREHGALSFIDTGRVTNAIACCKNIWASLPGAGYNQHENSLAMLIQAYKNSGGTVLT